MNNNNTLTDNQEKYNLLDQIEHEFKTQLGLTPCVGAEIEFYLSSKVDIVELQKTTGHLIKHEKGNNQYEIDLEADCSLAQYARSIESARRKILKGAKELGGWADFSSKPIKNDYGNSMHIHLNFLEKWDVEKCAKILCHYIARDRDIFLPQKEDLQRLDQQFMAPTHICYGGNNRTAAIRIPDSQPKRLEHRLAAASADPALVIHAILLSILEGLSREIDLSEYNKIYGNAYDPQYSLKKIKSSEK